MTFFKTLSLLFSFNFVSHALLVGPSNQDKAIEMFGRRFIVLPAPVPQPQPEDIDYYDAVARGLDNQDSKRGGVVDGSTANEAVLSEPDFDTMPTLKVSQKHLETKKFENPHAFSMETPESVETPASEIVDSETESSGQEPSKVHLVDGETGPPSIEPPRGMLLSKPPVASRFQ